MTLTELREIVNASTLDPYSEVAIVAIAVDAQSPQAYVNVTLAIDDLVIKLPPVSIWGIKIN